MLSVKSKCFAEISIRLSEKEESVSKVAASVGKIHLLQTFQPPRMDPSNANLFCLFISASLAFRNADMLVRKNRKGWISGGKKVGRRAL